VAERKSSDTCQIDGKEMVCHVSVGLFPVLKEQRIIKFVGNKREEKGRESRSNKRSRHEDYYHRGARGLRLGGAIIIDRIERAPRKGKGE